MFTDVNKSTRFNWFDISPTPSEIMVYYHQQSELSKTGNKFSDSDINSLNFRLDSRRDSP